MKHITRKRWLQLILATLIVIVGFAAIIPLAISTRYEKIIIQKLPEWVAKASDSLYTVSVEDIHISTFTKNITVKGLILRPDSIRMEILKARRMLPASIFSISIAKMEAMNIHWADLLANRDLSCKSLLIHQPKLIIGLSDTQYIKQDHVSSEKTAINRYKVERLQILQPDLMLMDHNRPDSQSFYLSGGKIDLSEWVFDPLIPEDTSLFLYAKSGQISIDSTAIKKKNGLYTFLTGDIHFISLSRSLEINNTRIRPAMSKEEFYKRIGHKDELYDVTLPKLIFSGFNWKDISRGKLFIQSVTAENPVASIYLNRQLPEIPKKKKTPSQEILFSRLPIAIDTIRIRGGTLRYTELSEKTNMEGTLPLDDITATLTNITNLRERIHINDTCVADIETKLFDASMVMQLKFPLSVHNGSFSATLKGGELDGRKINEITTPLASMKIESLNLKSADAGISYDGTRAKVNGMFLYDDLNLKVLKVTEDHEMKKKGLASFILNKALLYPSNPLPDEAPRKVNFLLVRAHDQSFFNLLWSCIRRGILLTAGRNGQIADIAGDKKVKL